MRKFLLVPAMLVSMLVVGCGLSPEQRQGLIDGVSEKVTVALQKKLREASGPVVEKVVAAVLKEAAELELSEDEIKQFGENVQKIVDNAIAELIDEKVPEVVKPVVEKVADKVLPKATEIGDGGGGAGKGVAGFLYMGLQMLLGLGKKVATGGLV